MIKEGDFLGKYAINLENELVKLTVLPDINEIVELSSKRTGHSHLLVLSSVEEGRVGWGAYDEEPKWTINKACTIEKEERDNVSIVKLRCKENGVEVIKEFALDGKSPKIAVNVKIVNGSSEGTWAGNRPCYRFLVAGGGVHGYTHTSHFGHRVFLTTGLPPRFIEQPHEKFTVGWSNYKEYVWEDCEWIAVVDTVNEEGVAIRFVSPTPVVKVIHEYHSIYVAHASTEQELKPGEDMEYSYEIILFDGLSRVDQVTENSIVGLEIRPRLFPGEEQTINFEAVSTEDATMHVDLDVSPVSDWTDGFKSGIKEQFTLSLKMMERVQREFRTPPFVLMPERYSLGPFSVKVKIDGSEFLRFFELSPELAGIISSIQEVVQKTEEEYNSGGCPAEVMGIALAFKTLAEEMVKTSLETGTRHEQSNAFYENLTRLKRSLEAFKEKPSWRIISDAEKIRRAVSVEPVKSWFEGLKQRTDDLIDKKVEIGYPRLRFVGVAGKTPFNYSRDAVACGFCYLATGNEVYGRKAAEILMEFARNHEKYGNCLGETLHLAEIAKWLVFAYDCIEDLLSPEEHGHILRYFFWLTDLTEPYVDTTASNWDVVEAAGLAWLAVRFNYLSGTRRKIERVVNVLKEQMNFIRSDGGWTEGAPGYHQLTLSNFMMASEALLKIGINLYDYSIEEKSFHSMIKWVMLMSTPYLRMPALEDSGHGPPSADIFILGAARYKDAAFLQFALKLAEKGVQPMDPIALSNYPFDLKPKPAEIPISQVLTGTGRILLRSGHEADGHYFILDYGPHGHGHGHPDKLSLELHAFSVPLVIDAGAGLYESTIHRTWHRHTRSHNTVMVDDESQRFTEGELLLFQSLPKSDFAQAAANVYEGIHHTRSVAYLRKQFFVISDVLESNRKHKFTWLLHPNFLPHQGNEGYCFEGPEREGLCVVPLDPSEVKDVELLEEPLLARRRRKGSRRRYLSWEKAAEPGRVYFNAVLIPYKGKMPKLKAEIGDSDGVAVIRVEKDGESYRIVFNCTCGEFATEELKSDASMLIQTGKDYLAAAKVREIKLMERFALKSMEVLAGLELDLRENQIVIRSEKPTKVQLKLADLKEVEADVEYAEKEGQLELKVDPGETRIRLFVEE